MTRRIPQVILALAILTPCTSVHSQRAKELNGFAPDDKSGNISKPADYRDRYELLGTYTIIDPKGNQMHVTYASPGTAAILAISQSPRCGRRPSVQSVVHTSSRRTG
jgi:hypothetical protein